MDARQLVLAGFMRQVFLWALLPIVAVMVFSPSVGDAQVTTTITQTTGTGNLGTTVNRAGNLYNIMGGTRPGNGPNLFHSFGDFSIGAGDIGNFLNNTGLPTFNILGRVTGGNISNIYGTIQTTGFGAANLFLMNPSGIVLGPNASLNVGGSVSFTTAQYIRLFDSLGMSANFYANPANDGLANSILAIDPSAFEFLSAQPAAYGFLTVPDPDATITVQGSTLSVPPSGQSISLVGGKVIIESGTPDGGTAHPAQLSAPNGKILLATAASPGEFDVNTLQSLPNVDGASFTSFGSISMAPGSSIDVHGTSMVWIKGGQLVLSVNDATLSTTESPTAPGTTDAISLSRRSSIMTSNAGIGPGADLQLIASNIQLDGAAIQSLTTSDGQGGNISIADAQSVNLTNGAQIVSDTKGGGDGGNITISTTNAPNSSVTASGFDSEFTLSGVAPFGVVASGVYSTASANGNGGQISITAPTVALDSFGTFATINSGDGAGGNISINATTVGGDGAFVLSSTGVDLTTGEIVGSGNGGNVTVQGLPGAADNAADSVTLTNGGVIFTQTSGLGRGGDVHITTDSLTIENGSGIFAVTGGGNGVGGDVSLNVGTLRLLGGDLGGSQIQSSSSNVGTDLDGDGVVDVPGGAGGNVTIQGISHEPESAADNVVLSGGSQMASLTEGSGDSGRIFVRAASLDLSEGSMVLSSTGGTGRGGDILVSVEEASLSRQATITSRTSFNGIDAGAGGTVTIQGLDGSGTKAESLTLADPSSGIISTAFGPGRLGDIEVHAKAVSLTNEAAILVGSTGDIAETAGNVTITADSVGISGGSAIASQVFTADAGQVSITANQLTLDDGLIVTSTSGPGRAGDVALNVGSLSLTNGSEISSASIATVGLTRGDGTTEPGGRAGNITISATGPLTSNASAISTSAEGNQGGNISITAQNVQLSNGTLINANSNAPLVVTKLVLDENGQLVEQVVGPGNAGNITINSSSSIIMQNSSVTTEAAQASGGQVTFTAPDMIQLVDSNISTSVAGSGTDTTGGNISIDPQFVILKNSQILAQAFAGSGGAIDITAGVFLADPSSIVDASSTLGISGTVQINAPINNLSSVVGRLSESVLAAQALLRAACAAKLAQGQVSSFVERGRDSIPTGPDGLLASPYLPPSSGPSAQMGGIRLGSDYGTSGESLQHSAVQVRRLLGPDSVSRVTILSGDTACSS